MPKKILNVVSFIVGVKVPGFTMKASLVYSLAGCILAFFACLCSMNGLWQASAIFWSCDAVMLTIERVMIAVNQSPS
jgi:hypothetical protein